MQDFVQHACEATHERVKRGGGGYTPAEKSLTATVVEVNSTGLEGPAANPNIKFRSFVCCGLNHAQLHDWIAVLTADPATICMFYDAWAYMRSSEQALSQMLEALRPLAGYKFALSMDYETWRWDPVQAPPAAPVRVALSAAPAAGENRGPCSRCGKLVFASQDRLKDVHGGYMHQACCR